MAVKTIVLASALFLWGAGDALAASSREFGSFRFGGDRIERDLGSHDLRMGLA